jgi:hypothetical protein
VQQGTVVIASMAVLLAAGCGSNGTSAGGDSSSDEIKVTLAEQNGSGESGTATLTADGDKTKVVLALQDRSATAAARPQPAHIHKGSCADLDEVPAYGLSDVKGGTSMSIVDAKLADLRTGAFAINVHESVEQISRYVACGDLGTGDSNGGSPPGYDKESDY